MKHKIIQLIQQDELRMRALTALHHLDLPQAYIAAGFIRNLIWDELHAYEQRTILNDIDVIYFAPNETLLQQGIHQHRLQVLMPELNWEVKNQAYMHLKHHHAPYQSILEAMSYWPEKETAIAIRMNQQQQLEILTVFDVATIFEGFISHNTYVPKSIFEQRLLEKRWLVQWPKLQVR